MKKLFATAVLCITSVSLCFAAEKGKGKAHDEYDGGRLVKGKADIAWTDPKHNAGNLSCTSEGDCYIYAFNIDDGKYHALVYGFPGDWIMGTEAPRTEDHKNDAEVIDKLSHSTGISVELGNE